MPKKKSQVVVSSHISQVLEDLDLSEKPRAHKERVGVGSAFPCVDDVPVDTLISSLNSLISGKGGKGSWKSVRKNTYTLPANPSISVTSYTCPEHLYTKDPPVLPTLARGLFVRQNKKGANEIVVRGYDKFFNVGETTWTSRDNLRARTVGPYEVTVKENGCIIFISQVEGEILVTSKHAVQVHAAKGMEWLERHLKDAGSNKEELAAFLKEHDVTAVFELADDDFEEHILEYPEGKRGLYLHGINENKPYFETWPSAKVQDFATRFGVFVVDYLTFDTFDEVMKFTGECGETGSYGGRAVEGFVVRCRSGHEGKTMPVFFKIKYEEPYLMYREWREVTKSILSQKGRKWTPRHQLTRRYVEWVLEKTRSNPELFDEYQKNKGIIRARNLFLEHSGLKPVDVLAAAQETTEEFKRGEATAIPGEEGVFNGPTQGSSKSVDVPDIGSLTLAEKVVPSKLLPSDKPRKILLLPVGIVGLGKSALGHALTGIFPTLIRHVQSDDTKKRFVESVVREFETSDIVYADKCNHEAFHRREITSALKNKYPNGESAVLALEWQLGTHDKANKDRIFRLAEERITKRGENHQTLTPGKTPQFQKVIRMFLGQFTGVDTSARADKLIDAVLPIDPESSTVTRLRDVCEAIGFAVPADEELMRIFGELPAERSAAAVSRVVSAEVSSGKAELMDPGLRPRSSRLRVGNFYYGIYVSDPILLVSVLDALFTRIRKDHPDVCTVWDAMKAGERIQKRFHVTLCLTKFSEDAELVEQYATIMEGEGLGKDDLEETSETQSGNKKKKKGKQKNKGGGRTPENGLLPGIRFMSARDLHFEVEEVVFDDRVMCIPVKVLPEGFNCRNRWPHVTVGTTADKFRPMLSNEVLGKWGGARGEQQVEKGEGWTRVSFGGAVEFTGRLAQFLG
ncbi:hypothetical protein HK101_006310 [Irineochytrium annulatum]|nr:hypothetical protein HK101_006310 [Irineochytrium annulatum]